MNGLRVVWEDKMAVTSNIAFSILA
jgi:hypothetical protein